jgi:Fe-S oxidoreductase
LVKTLILVNMPNFLEFKMLEKLLKGVEKPGRYVNHEAGTKSKSLKYIDAHPGTILAALFFPDIYEVGMSNAGIEILYDIINKSPHYSAERVFSPWVDFEESLRKNKILLFSLENRIFLNNFDLIGFNAAHEMLYTNILNALDLSGIDHISEKRNSIFPLVCAGGTSVFNPWPLSKFMDFMVIGDGEEVISRIMETIKDFKEENTGQKKELLKKLSALDGVFVPQFYKIIYNSNSEIQSIKSSGEGKTVVKKAVLKDLDSFKIVCDPVIPNIRVVHDRFAVEIWLQQGMQFLPGRFYLPACPPEKT